MSNLDGARCVGRHELFESTQPEAHRYAKALCDACPVIAACRKLVPPGNEEPTGTWAGKLYGVGRQRDRIDREDAMFTPGEARAAHSAFMRGERHDRAVIGERVYQRNRTRIDAGRRLDVECRECGAHRPHAGRGMCSGCYKRARRTEQEGASAGRPAKPRPGGDLLAEWGHLRSLGVSAHHAAQQLGVTVDAIKKATERARGAA